MSGWGKGWDVLAPDARLGVSGGYAHRVHFMTPVAHPTDPITIGSPVCGYAEGVCCAITEISFDRSFDRYYLCEGCARRRPELKQAYLALISSAVESFQQSVADRVEVAVEKISGSSLPIQVRIPDLLGSNTVRIFPFPETITDEVILERFEELLGMISRFQTPWMDEQLQKRKASEK